MDIEERETSSARHSSSITYSPIARPMSTSSDLVYEEGSFASPRSRPPLDEDPDPSPANSPSEITSPKDDSLTLPVPLWWWWLEP